MKSLVLLADGCEEVEALAIIDVLRRGAVEVITASVTGRKSIRGSHSVVFEADSLFDPADTSFDMVAFPGGMGCMTALRSDERVIGYLQKMAASGKFVGAVCASPAVLGKAGLLEGKRFCCYPGIEREIEGGVYVSGVEAVRDGAIITGSGPGTALSFALTLLEAIAGREVRNNVASAMLLPSILP